MIDPQSTTLRQGYEPYTAITRAMFLNAGHVGYLESTHPDLSNRDWYHLITFDHGHTLIEVVCKGFQTVEAAQKALFWVLSAHPVKFKIGGVTTLISEDEYARIWDPSLPEFRVHPFDIMPD